MENNDIAFSLLENAMDSIEQSIDLLAWNEDLQDGSRLKQAILLVAHACELLLKERLRRVHPSLIWEDVEKYPAIEARTVSIDRALVRLDRIGNVTLSELDKRTLRSLRTTRNAIEHFSWRTSRDEADVIAGRGLSFAVHFAAEHLNSSIDYRFRNDDTWSRLLGRNRKFAEAHGDRIEEALRRSGTLLEECSFCNAMARDLSTGSCSLCGHWESVPDDVEDLF